MTDELLTPKEVAERLKLSTRGVYELIRSGDLKALKLGHRTMRIKRSDLENYINGSVLNATA